MFIKLCFTIRDSLFAKRTSASHSRRVSVAFPRLYAVKILNMGKLISDVSNFPNRNRQFCLFECFASVATHSIGSDVPVAYNRALSSSCKRPLTSRSGQRALMDAFRKATPASNIHGILYITSTARARWHILRYPPEFVSIGPNQPLPGSRGGRFGTVPSSRSVCLRIKSLEKVVLDTSTKR